MNGAAEALGALLGQHGLHGRITGLRRTALGGRRARHLFELDGDPLRRFVASGRGVGRTMERELAPDVEAGLLEVLRTEGLPVPEPVATGPVPELGGAVLVTRYVPGEAVPRRLLPTLGGTASGARVAAAAGRALGRLHGLDAAAWSPSLPQVTLVPPAERLLAELRARSDDLLRPSPVLALAERWLDAHRPPAPARIRLVHGDARVGNLVVDGDRLAAVLDWGCAHPGDPLEDLAWFCLRTWRFGRRDLGAGGLAPAEVLLDAWCGAGGAWNAAAFHWWSVAGALRRALELAEQSRAHLEGRARDVVLAGSGRHVPELEQDLLRLLGSGPGPRNG